MTKSKNILITGGAGFIGSCLAEEVLQRSDYSVVIVDNLITGDKKKIPFDDADRIKFIHCDVNNEKEIRAVFYSFNFEFVFHFAALVGVQRTLNNPVKVLEDINGIKNILNLCKNTGVKRVFYSSSSEVYGEPVEFPQNEETTPLNSKLPYAIVKNVGEAFLKSYQKEYGLDYTIFRFFNTYGPKQSKDFVMSKFINAALKDKDITVYGDGLQTRTFCFVKNNIDACFTTAFENKFINETVNIGSETETTIKDLAELIIELTNSSSKIIYLPPLPEGDMSRRKPDISKMNSIITIPRITLEKGIRNILENPSYITD